MKERNQKKEKQERKESPQSINRWLVFSIIATALLMNTIDSTIVATALHTLQNDLDTTVSWVGWTLTAYSLGFVLMLPLSAKLSVQFGHRRIFILSIALFTLASLFCGLATNIETLIVLRVVQAIGGAGVTPSATGLIVEYFGKSRAQFLGLFGSMFAIGVIIGPIFGGIFVTYLSWPWIFYINIPFGLFVILMAYRFIPNDDLTKTKREKIDFKGLILMGIAILSIMYAATYLERQDSSAFSFIFMGLMDVSIITFWLFFRHLRRTPFPFILPELISGKGFGAVNIVNIVYAGIAIGGNSLVPLYAVNRYGISELSSGTLLVADGAASVIISVVLSMYINRTGYRIPLYIGGAILATGVGVIAFEPLWNISPFYWLMIGTALVGVGLGTMSPAARNAGIQLAPDQSANIAAIRSLGLQLGQILGIAIATAIIGAAYNPVHAHAMVYVGISILLFLVLPVIAKVPEHKGAW